MNKKKSIIGSVSLMTIVLGITAIGLCSCGTKDDEKKTTTVTTISQESIADTTVIDEISTKEPNDSVESDTENSLQEVATNKTYGDNQGDNYAIDIFTDQAVENQTKSKNGTTKKSKKDKKSDTSNEKITKKDKDNINNEKTTKKDQNNTNSEKTTKKENNDPNSDDGWTDFY